MDNKILIKARERSFAWGDEQGVIQIIKGKDNKEEVGGVFNGLKFPKTTQMPRVFFDSMEKRWMIYDNTGALAENGEDLNRWVASCSLYIESGKDKGEKITSTDVNDFNDKFFNHSRLRIILQEGQGAFSVKDPIAKVVTKGLSASKTFSSKVGNVPVSVQYFISDTDFETKKDKDIIKGTQKAVALFSALSLDKKKVLVQLLSGVKADSDVTEDTLDKRLWEFVSDSTTKIQGKTKQQMFIELAESDPDSLYNRGIVSTAINKGIIKIAGGVYKYEDEKIGNTKEKLFAYFLDPSNASKLSRLNEQVNDSE
jgi:hypothetical protein